MNLNKFQREEIVNKIRILGLGSESNIYCTMVDGKSLSISDIQFEGLKDNCAEDSVTLFKYISGKDKDVEIKRVDGVLIIRVSNQVLHDVFLKV